MSSTGILPPPPFLATPGTPDVPWARWLRLFERFLLASGATELPAPRRRALLLHCLGTEGQRIFDALPPSTTQTKAELTSAAPGVAPTPDAAAGIIGTTAATGTQDGTTGAPRPPDEYDVAVEMLSKHFAAPCNVRLQRHRFRARCQLQGEPITDFAVALRELAALCNFATQADENLCEQFVAGVTCPRLRERLLLEGDNLTFDHAVEVARLREQTQLESEAFVSPMQRIQQQLRGSSARQGRRDNGDKGTGLPGRRHLSCSRAYSAPEVHQSSGRRVKEAKFAYNMASRAPAKVARELARNFWLAKELQARTLTGQSHREGPGGVASLPATPSNWRP
ncbi:uncharacterized protein LOC144166076 [Haemaphysalis longicornis]